ncbi:nucleotidyltransferase domain-containing protein [Paenibacillus sp. 32352]|uniref:nucleotidyltransferase domain-containing protein n=1 Tax=Paenibacillus sp. 32352 TaxID=1969111 RepID=UPI0009AEBA0A|nr:nucleotidyltransferase domain-containing protein [Paenibacillus sp. 32352]
MDVFAVAELLVQRIRKHYPQDIAIAGYYGSYLQGRATERSDLDFFFIPATDRGQEVELQFIIDGIGFDFWPIRWERAEKMAAFENWSTTIIADCELLYVRSEEDYARFLGLRDKIASMKEPDQADGLLDKAEAVLHNGLVYLTKMRLAGGSLDLSYCRMLAHEVIVSLFESLALVNQTYYTRMWGHFREQVRSLPIQPESLDSCLDTAMFSRSTTEIMQACEQMTGDMLRLLSSKRKNRRGSRSRSYQERMKGYYEETKGLLNKMLTACEQGHYETAHFTAIHVQDSLAQILYEAEEGQKPSLLDLGDYRRYYQRFGYPDMIALLDPDDFEPLRTAVLEMAERLERHLRSEEVTIRQFHSVADFECYLNGLHP